MSGPHVDVALRCDCEAAIVGRIHKQFVRRAIRTFAAVHAPECRRASREALRLTLAAEKVARLRGGA